MNKIVLKRKRSMAQCKRRCMTNLPRNKIEMIDKKQLQCRVQQL
jgi:ferredoxin